MAKVRVFELAKELNMPSKDLVALLNDLGVKAKNHMSAIDENAARYVMRKYGPEARGAQPGKDQAQPAASGDRQAAGRAPSAQQPASTQARPAQAEPTVLQQARPQPPAPQQRPPQRPAAGHPAGAPQRHDDRARQSSISRPQAGQQGPRQAQPSQPLDPSYPFIPSRARPRSQGMPPRYGQPGQPALRRLRGRAARRRGCHAMQAGIPPAGQTGP